MKRRNFVQSAAIGTTAALSAGASSSVMAQDKMRLRLQSYWGKEADAVFDAFLDNVKTASDGTIRIQRFTGSAIVPDEEMLQAVSAGTLDMAEGYGGYWPGKVDIAAIEAGLPGAWTNYDEAQYIFRHKGLTELAREAYAEQGVHYLGPVFGGAYDLLTKNPVKGLDDMRQMKIRATPSVAKVLQKLDIPTVFMPGSELYVGLSTGAIDGLIFGGPIEYKTMKLFEAAKHYTYLNMLDPGYTDDVLINKAKWDSMTEAQQKTLEMAYETHATNLHSWVVSGNIDTAAEGIFEFSRLPAEDSAQLTKAAQTVWDEEAARSERAAKAIQMLRDTAKATGRG